MPSMTFRVLKRFCNLVRSWRAYRTMWATTFRPPLLRVEGEADGVEVVFVLTATEVDHQGNCKYVTVPRGLVISQCFILNFHILMTKFSPTDSYSYSIVDSSPFVVVLDGGRSLQRMKSPLQMSPVGPMPTPPRKCMNLMMTVTLRAMRSKGPVRKRCVWWRGL